MRNWLASLSMAACLAVLVPFGARAQLPVTDGGNLIAQAKNLLQELKSYATQLQQLSQEIQQVTWLAQTAASLIQNPNLGAVMQLMNMVGLENPLPVSPYAVQGLISGYGGMNGISGIVGKLNSLGSLITTSYQTDHVYSCEDNSFACQQQRRLAHSDAGLKGITSEVYTQLTQRIPILQGLREQLSLATTPAQRENIMAQVALENAWAQNTQGQLQTVVALAGAQKQVDTNRENEHLAESIDAVLAAAPKH
jgi:hypothetical protein